MKFFTQHLHVSLEHWTFSCEFFSLSWSLSLSSLSKVQMMNWYMYVIVQCTTTMTPRSLHVLRKNTKEKELPINITFYKNACSKKKNYLLQKSRSLLAKTTCFWTCSFDLEDVGTSFEGEGENIVFLAYFFQLMNEHGTYMNKSHIPLL